ncbi:MAG TPA: VacB/RNase II family 3'-5' exoribonuclease [Planctomycetota bacterium]|nr:VacB/RNase II family 3'-5' exoribonuclease [Planctomycetota bacterium]
MAQHHSEAEMSSETILAFFSQQPEGQGFKFATLMQKLNIGPHQERTFRRKIKELIEAGKLSMREGRIARGARRDIVTGRLQLKRDGFGFLICEEVEHAGEDIFLPAANLAGAHDGDRVEVELVERRERNDREGRHPRGRQRPNNRPGGNARDGSRGGLSKVGRVVKILQRSRTALCGSFVAAVGPYDSSQFWKDAGLEPHGGIRTGRGGHGGHRSHESRPSKSKPRRKAISASNEPTGGRVVPEMPGWFDPVLVAPEDQGLAKDGDKVELELLYDDPRSRTGLLHGRVAVVLGVSGEAKAEVESIVRNYGVRTHFPAPVVAEAASFSLEINDAELARRVDHRHQTTVTIDPVDAKDFDDAISIDHHQDGSWTLYVHIADVSHFVREGSLLDIEARERGNSTYLPGVVYPMLPPALSNDLCSLRPHIDRLTKTVVMDFDPHGQFKNYIIQRSVINSKMRLSYEGAREILEGRDTDVKPSILTLLKHMRTLAELLRKRRFDNGSLDLEMGEVELVLDERTGEVTGFRKADNDFTHQMIEDCMLAANRAVAEYTVAAELANVYRTHDDPDPAKLDRFAKFARTFDIKLRAPYTRFQLQGVLEMIRGQKYQTAVSFALLTSLAQARYSERCEGHYALGFAKYSHFTSPIRRYADLVTHRALDQRMGDRPMCPPPKERLPGSAEEKRHREAWLHGVALHISSTERRSAEAENAVKTFRQIEYLEKHRKDWHMGVITRVREFGFTVELQDCLVDAICRLRDMRDDFYDYLEDQHAVQGRRFHKRYQLGDVIRVEVTRVDISRREVDAKPIEMPDDRDRLDTRQG